DDDDDYGSSRRRGGGGQKPSSVQMAGVMMLIGGIVSLLGALAWLSYYGVIVIASGGLGLICCLWPGPYYAVVVGIMALIRATQLMGDNAYKAGPGIGIAIMMIINVINGDLVTMAMGIVALVMLNNEESKRSFGQGPYSPGEQGERGE